MIVYIGTYTWGESESKGIYSASLDTANGTLSDLRVVAEAGNPGFLALHPNRQWLLAASELYPEEANRNAVASFKIDSATGDLAEIDKKPVGGKGACHISIDATGKCALTAHYGSGSIALHRIDADGGLSDPMVIQHEGSSVNPKRQQEPHAHSIKPGPDNRYAYAADLGCDKVFIYKLDPEAGSLTPADPAFATLEPGSGPRHFAFHPTLSRAYVLGEILRTVTVFERNPETGGLAPMQTLSTLPEEAEASGSTAEILVSPDGKFVYSSNRGHDSISIFAVDPNNGKLALIGTESTRGRTPRNFNLDPTGTWLIAANQDTSNVAVYRRDATSGLLEPVGDTLDVPVPVCVLFY